MITQPGGCGLPVAIRAVKARREGRLVACERFDILRNSKRGDSEFLLLFSPKTPIHERSWRDGLLKN